MSRLPPNTPPSSTTPSPTALQPVRATAGVTAPGATPRAGAQTAAGPATPVQVAAVTGAQALQPSAIHRAFEASLEFFLGPLLPFLRDPEVTEIMVNGPTDVYVERGGQITRTQVVFQSEADVQAAARNVAQFVGQPISEERPIMDGRLPDGSRVCVVLGTVAARGTQINIRRFPHASGTPQFLIDRGAITPMAMEFLLLAVRAKCNVMVSGGAGCGKTTLLNVLSTAFGAAERILVIEDTRELQIQREHVVQMEARPPDAHGKGQITIRDLFAASLRMRPDRIIIGEVRRGEALDMIQAMTSGHRGALATVHASTPYDACHRVETLAMMADVGIPLHALRRQVSSAIDLLVQAERLSSGRRLISCIAEVSLDEATQAYVLHELFRLEGEGNARQLVWTGGRSRTLDTVAEAGLGGQMQLTLPMHGR